MTCACKKRSLRRLSGRVVTDMFSLFPLIMATLTLGPDIAVSGERIEVGQEAPIDGMLLSPASWILLRSYVDADRCSKAVDACSQGCEEQIELILAECRGREGPDDDLVIAALQGELDTEREMRENLESQNKILKYVAIGAGIALVGMGTTVYITTR